MRCSLVAFGAREHAGGVVAKDRVQELRGVRLLRIKVVEDSVLPQHPLVAMKVLPCVPVIVSWAHENIRPLQAVARSPGRTPW